MIGVRRLIAERMSEAKRNIPHFAYVEEVDVTELEALRQHLNAKLAEGEPGLTYLPLVIAALVRVLESFPQCNVLYDAARGVLVRHRAVHVGIATQTPDGLKVPVVRNAQALTLVGNRGRDPPRRRARAHQQGDPRRTDRLDDHRHEPGQAWRHRLDTRHQRAGSGHHRPQQGGGPAGRSSGPPARSASSDPVSFANGVATATMTLDTGTTVGLQAEWLRWLWLPVAGFALLGAGVPARRGRNPRPASWVFF